MTLPILVHARIVTRRTFVIAMMLVIERVCVDLLLNVSSLQVSDNVKKY